MKVKIVPTNEILATHGGNLLLGELLSKTKIVKRLNELSSAVIPMTHGITTGDVILTYIGMLCQA